MGRHVAHVVFTSRYQKTTSELLSQLFGLAELVHIAHFLLHVYKNGLARNGQHHRLDRSIAIDANDQTSLFSIP